MFECCCFVYRLVYLFVLCFVCYRLLLLCACLFVGVCFVCVCLSCVVILFVRVYVCVAFCVFWLLFVSC